MYTGFREREVDIAKLFGSTGKLIPFESACHLPGLPMHSFPLTCPLDKSLLAQNICFADYGTCP